MQWWTNWLELGQRFWNDDAALTVCSEAVLVGTVAVLAVTTGLSIAVDAFEDEALDYASALRGLNQGYHVDGYQVPGAYTEPSGFVQTPEQVRRDVERFRQQARRRIEQARQEREAIRRRLQQRLKPADPEPDTSEAPQNPSTKPPSQDAPASGIRAERNVAPDRPPEVSRRPGKGESLDPRLPVL